MFYIFKNVPTVRPKGCVLIDLRYQKLSFWYENLSDTSVYPSSKKRYNRPVEVFSGSQLHTFSRQYHYLFKSCGLIRRYIVLWFLPKKTLLLQTKYEIKGLGSSQGGANISVSRFLQVCSARQQICIHWWVILSIFVSSWNRPLFINHIFLVKYLVSNSFYFCIKNR